MRRAWNTSSTRIVAGLCVGLGAGALIRAQNWSEAGALLGAAATIGGLWLNALTMTVVPLVFALLVTGVAGAATSASTSHVTLAAIVWFGVFLLAACLLGAAAATGLLSVIPIPALAEGLRPAGDAPQIAPAGGWLKGLIPTNPLKAAAETAIAPLVVFALFFGLALTRIDPQLRSSVTTLLRGVVEAMLVIVRWVLLAAPLGVAALALGVSAQFGVGAAGALVHYMAVVSLVCLAVTAVAYLVVWAIGGLTPAAFAKAALPAQVVALSTQSSLASLPAMVKACEPLGISPEQGGVVLSLAVAVFRAASAAANVTVAVYLAHLHGQEISMATIGIGVAVAAIVSLAAVGLPAQVSFFATIGPVCLAMGVPITLLGLLLAVETVPDVFRTLGNVTADLAVTRIVGRTPRRA